jgi:hypothetical protein
MRLIKENYMALKSINQDDLRNHNLSVVLSMLLQSAKPMSRARLAKETGLTKATLSLLVPLLLSAHALEEGEPVSDGVAYGWLSTPLSVSEQRFCSIGMQINTDGYGVIILGLDGAVIAEEWVSESVEQISRKFSPSLMHWLKPVNKQSSKRSSLLSVLVSLCLG